MSCYKLQVANQMLDPKCDGEMSFDLNSFLNRHAKVVDLGTHTLWDNRPPMESSIITHPKTILTDCSKIEGVWKSDKNLPKIYRSESPCNNSLADTTSKSQVNYLNVAGDERLLHDTVIIEYESNEKSITQWHSFSMTVYIRTCCTILYFILCLIFL